VTGYVLWLGPARGDREQGVGSVGRVSLHCCDDACVIDSFVKVAEVVPSAC
jgi:hypothetical protein